jgi:hypothetical protein
MNTLIKWLVDMFNFIYLDLLITINLPKILDFLKGNKFYFNIYIWHLMVIDIDIGFLKEKS